MPNNKPTPARQYLSELCAQFPAAATKTLARKAYAAHPECWRDLEACRQMLRVIRGNAGDFLRKQVADKRHFRPNGTTGDPNQFKLPEPWEFFPDWQIRNYDLPGWWAVLSDIHAPFHSVSALTACVKLAKERGVVGILLNGDTIDCHYANSKFEPDPRKRNFNKELQALRALFEALRGQFPKIPIIWKHGNHEERYDRWMAVKAAEMLDVAEWQFGNISHAEMHGIEIVAEKQPISLGKLIVIHGHEYNFPISNPVNAARGLFLRAQVSALCGHFHSSASHSEKNLREHVVTCWASGCLCGLRPQYRPINKWNHGAALVELAKDGAFQVENFRVLDGKVYR